MMPLDDFYRLDHCVLALSSL